MFSIDGFSPYIVNPLLDGSLNAQPTYIRGKVFTWGLFSVDIGRTLYVLDRCGRAAY